jgi:hypothetical protein
MHPSPRDPHMYSSKPSGMRRALRILLIILGILLIIGLTRHFTLNDFTFNPHG